jgi:hypothetical protein
MALRSVVNPQDERKRGTSMQESCLMPTNVNGTSA